MQWHQSGLKATFGKAVLSAAVLGGFIFLGGASSAQAAQDDDYHRPVERYYEGRDHYRPEPEHWRHERYERYERHERREREREYERGWYDRFGCFHRY